MAILHGCGKAPAVASGLREAYLRAMSASALLRLLTLIALFLAPLAMIGAAPATAHGRSAAAAHCAETGKPAEAPPSAPIDCMIACAGCLPAQGGLLGARPPLAPTAQAVPLHFQLHGLHPEAATPPPRRS